MRWIQLKEKIPELQKNLVVARKSNFIRTGQEIKCLYYTLQLLLPSKIHHFMDKNLYIWCKSALHLDEPHKFDLERYIKESEEEGLLDQDRIYLKVSPLDFYIDELSIPEAKADFS